MKNVNKPTFWTRLFILNKQKLNHPCCQSENLIDLINNMFAFEWRQNESYKMVKVSVNNVSVLEARLTSSSINWFDLFYASRQENCFKYIESKKMFLLLSS